MVVVEVVVVVVAEPVVVVVVIVVMDVVVVMMMIHEYLGIYIAPFRASERLELSVYLTMGQWD